LNERPRKTLKNQTERETNRRWRKRKEDEKMTNGDGEKREQSKRKHIPESGYPLMNRSQWSNGGEKKGLSRASYGSKELDATPGVQGKAFAIRGGKAGGGQTWQDTATGWLSTDP